MKETVIVGTEQRNKIHPHKFTMWIGIGSIIMMFAGLTSAYIVKSGQAGWHEVKTPAIFLFSTLALLISSVCIQASVSSFKQRNMKAYRTLLLLTLLLGIAFVVMQYEGFMWLWERGVHFEGSSGAGQFLYVIFGLHALHVIGGIVALMVILGRHFFGNRRTYNATPVEIMATYWHFVDLLWIYLLVFFIWLG